MDIFIHLEDEETTGNLKEDLDRVDVIENTVNLEENPVPKEKSQEKIDISEKLEEVKPELDALEGESEDKTDLLRERIKLKSEESDEEKNEQLQEIYHQETGKRPIYAKKKTKDYIHWLEQRELKSEKIENSQNETETIKEIEDEDWKKTLKKWMKEASEDECGAELKSELKKALESYNEFEILTRKFFELYKKSQNEILSEKEKSRMASLLEKLQEFDPIQLELLANIRAIKKYIVEQYGWDSMNRFRDYRVRNRFFEQSSQIYKNLTTGKQPLVNQKVNMSELNKINNIFTFENYGLIYLITNLINGKVYVGKTIQKLKRRMQQHLADVRLSRKQTFLVYAIKKYGKENFEVEILNFFDSKESLSQAEKYYIKKFKSNAFRYSKGYNMTDGGETFRILYGEEHPMFVNIDIESLKELIQEGFTISEMAEEFKVSSTVIHNRVKEMGFINIEDARRVLGGSNKRLKIRSSRMSQSGKGKVFSDKTRAIWSDQRKGSKNPKFIKLNQNQLIQAIKECGKKKGGRFTLVDVGKELNTTKNTAMHKIKQLLGISFPEAKNQHFFAPIIKELIKNGKIAREISNELGYTDQSWTNKKIRELWGLSLRGAIRRFRAYPKINNELLISLVSENLSAKEIDEIFIKNLILGYTIREITEFLEIDSDTFYKLVRGILGFNNLTEARYELGGPEVFEFFEHARREKISRAHQKYNIAAHSLKTMIESGLKVGEIAEEFGCSKKTIHVKIRELFNKRFSHLRDKFYWKPLLKSLIKKNLSVNEMASELKMGQKNLGALIRRLFGTESVSVLREREDF